MTPRPVDLIEYATLAAFLALVVVLVYRHRAMRRLRFALALRLESVARELRGGEIVAPLLTPDELEQVRRHLGVPGPLPLRRRIRAEAR